MIDPSTQAPLVPPQNPVENQPPIANEAVTPQSPVILPPSNPPQFSNPTSSSITAAMPSGPLPLIQPMGQPATTSAPPGVAPPSIGGAPFPSSSTLLSQPMVMPSSASPVEPVAPESAPPDVASPTNAIPTAATVPPASTTLTTNPFIRQNQVPLVASPTAPIAPPNPVVQPQSPAQVADVATQQSPQATVPSATVPPTIVAVPPPSIADAPAAPQMVAPATPIPTPTPAETSSTQAPTDSSSATKLEPILSRSTEPMPIQQNSYKGPRPCVLLILDGWGIGPNNAGNAIARAQTPNLSKYWLSFPHTQLEASGTAVGLPQGEDGNTETGHLNIGAGHIVYQDLPRINMSIADGGFFQNSAFLKAINHAKTNNSTLHLMGLIGAGGVHSNIEHLYALLNLCAQQQLSKVLIHGFTDGRDSPPTSGITYVQEIMNLCEKLGVGQLASLMGRYFAMDRDRRWERIEKAYDALTIGEGNSCIISPIDALKQQYDQGVTDEFIEPITICNKDGSHRVISDNDAVIFFNYRIDRPRELTRAFVLPNFENGMTSVAFDPYAEKYEKTNIQKSSAVSTFQRKKIISNMCFTTMTMYEDNMPVEVAFPPQHIKEPLGKVFADNGLRQLRTTETEKERFVTYYMNGQIETMYAGEERVILPSKGVKSYDEAPEMSAREITQELLKYLETNLYDVVIANICNGDMVGHTGNIEAAVQACTIVDEVVGKIVEKVLLLNGMVFITADHGNVEEMINNSTGEVDTEHSIYPVPFYIIGKQFAGKSTMLPTGILADVAPTILHCMGIAKPSAMTGRALI